LSLPGLCRQRLHIGGKEVKRFIQIPQGRAALSRSAMKNNRKMKKNWNILSNRFDIATRRNYKKMLMMLAHHARMVGASSDPFIRNLFRETGQMMESYCKAHALWESAKGGRRGESVRFRKLMKKLYTEMIPDWEANVLIRFPQRSPEYNALFSGGRTEFRRGPYDQRIAKVASLAKKMEAYDGLQAVRLEVEDFHAKLLAACRTNKSDSGGVKEAALRLESARRAAAVRMYANLGLLMSRFCNEPVKVKRYFAENKAGRKPKKKASVLARNKAA
jgi:hypothetical protein